MADLILAPATQLFIDRMERNKAFRSLDIQYARRLWPRASDRECLAALHMARYECDEIDDELRHQSREWLKNKGYGRITGLPFEPDNQLPSSLV